MAETWSAPDAEPLAWFGLPSGASPAEHAFGPGPVERLRIRGLDLEFCRRYYARYRVRQKERMAGQGFLF